MKMRALGTANPALLNNNNNNNNNINQNNTIALPKGNNENVHEVAGAQDTIYLCNFRVSVDGEWLCLKELQDLDIKDGRNGTNNEQTGQLTNFGIESGEKCDTKIEREWVNYYSRDPAAIERSNLINICKLVVKELLEQSLRFGRMLDSDHLPLQHFFIVLEHVLRHGLRPKKGLLGPKKELWDILQSVEKYSFEAQDITSSVRDLPTVRTHMGRARAWLRLALMQKKIADYLQALVEHRDEALAEYYEPHALMMSDEIVVIMGILVGLNVIDCNLCVKEEDLDSQQGVIDFSLYLRSSSRTSPEDDVHDSLEGTGTMTAVLDQKNYIEELNRHLNATVANLQAKVEALTTTNALQKEDLAIARNNILALQAENMGLRRNAEHGPIGTVAIQDNTNVLERFDAELAESLAEERKKKYDIEKELELQISLKAETEMAMKLLEKDIHEKQDTIISLRRQLEDIKLINLEMYKKLQECEDELTQKGEMVARLQAKASQIGKILQTLEKKYETKLDSNDLLTTTTPECEASVKHKTELMSKLESQKESMANAILQIEKKYASETASLNALQETSQALSLQVVSCEERAARAEVDLRIEREWRNSLQEKEVKNKEQINSLQLNMKQMNDDAKKHEKIKEDLKKVQNQWTEAQRTLEELGMQLSHSKLQISDLKEKALNVNDSSGVWTPDKMTSRCKSCSREFSITRRKHHCRNCGEIFCHNCSDQVALLVSETKPVRVCDGCWDNLKN